MTQINASVRYRHVDRGDLQRQRTPRECVDVTILQHLGIPCFQLRRVVGAIFGVLALGASSHRVHAAAYSVTDLGTLGGNSSSGYAINDAGQVVGTSYLDDNSTIHAFLYTEGNMVDLGTLGGDSSYAQSVNASGQVVGYSITSGGAAHAFLYENGGIIDIGTLGGPGSFANGINAAATIVGNSNLSAPCPTCPLPTHAFLYQGGSMLDLGTLGGASSYAQGINASGQVVGFSNATDGTIHAFVYENGSMTDIGTLGGAFSKAYGINDSGRIVGESTPAGSGYAHAFLYTNGNMTDLGALGDSFSTAFSVNASGQVVGVTSSASGQTGFLYSSGSMFDLRDLTPPGTMLTHALSINAAGQIAGIAGNHAVRLTPNHPVAVAVAQDGYGNPVVGPVAESAAVMLDSSASTAAACSRPGAPTPCPRFSWSQIGGPIVPLLNANSATPTLTTPNLAVGQTSQVLSYQVVVSDGLFSSNAVVELTVQHRNLPPVAQVESPLIVNEGSPVTLNGSASYDPEASALTYSWSNTSSVAPCSDTILSGEAMVAPTFTAPLVGSAGATCTFDLTVSDADGLASAPPARVVVMVENVNHPPTADAGSNATANIGDTVTLNGNGSLDLDNDPLQYLWSQISGPSVTLSGANNATPSFVAPTVATNQTLIFELTINDGTASATSQVSVLVLAPAAPPACGNAKADPKRIEKADHRLHPIEIEQLGEDKREWITGDDDESHDNVRTKILTVRQDEPTSGLGSGDTSPDAAILTTKRERDKLLLRAERREGGNGRVYTVTFRATDKAGHSCQGTVKVCVPATNKQKACIDDGPNVDSLTR